LILFCLLASKPDSSATTCKCLCQFQEPVTKPSNQQPLTTTTTTTGNQASFQPTITTKYPFQTTTSSFSVFEIGLRILRNQNALQRFH
jgi:hypothetical protein